MTIRTLFWGMMLILPFGNVFSQATFEVKTIIPPALLDVQAELKDYDVIRIDSRALLQTLASGDSTIIFAFENMKSWQFALTPARIKAPLYQRILNGEKGQERSTGSEVQTFSGQIQSPGNGQCRLTVAEGFIYGIFEIGETTWFIEPARRFAQSAGFDTYLLYRAADVLPNPNGICAATTWTNKENGIAEKINERSCYTVGLALAADYQMFMMFPNIETLENYVLGILNNVHLNYDDEFIHTIRFQAVGLFVATCEFCDEWDPGFGELLTDYQELLAAFRDWSNGGGLGLNYDLATLWTGRVLDDGIGGGGYNGSLCGNQRYQILRRYSENAGLMRALQAHEFGHNFNANHDLDNEPYIMTPRIRDFTEWSVASKNRINTYIGRAINFFNCLESCTERPNPQALFTANTTSGCAPFSVQFTNQSLATANSWQWFFPGGTPATSLAKNPTVDYPEPGIFEVQLIVSSPIGSDTLRQLAFIEIKDQPTAAFSANTTLGSTYVIFNNNATDADAVTWDFGDGTTSNQWNPDHSYNADGIYEVTQTVVNACGSDVVKQSILIVTPPTADFSAQTLSGCTPFHITFANQSSDNATSFTWQFPGGMPNSSAAKTPSVTYDQPGTYAVTLVATNAAGNSEITKTAYITVTSSPKTAFAFAIDTKTVRFINESTLAQSYLWNFGDGNASTNPQPTHTYETAGTYEVTLITTNDCGNDTLAQTVTIGGALPVANFTTDVLEGCAPFTAQFFDNSGNTQNRRWYFPGGTPATSTAQNPLIEYAVAGTFPVALRVENIWGQDSVYQEEYISVLGKPNAAFSVLVNGLEIALQPTATNTNWQYFWDFGDGNASTEPMPIHRYEQSGHYEVELVVTNICGVSIGKQNIALVTTRIDIPSTLTKIQVTPNPNNGQFQLSLVGEPQLLLSLRILNVLGQPLHQQRIDFSQGFWSAQLEKVDWPNGLYWLQISNKQTSIIRPFVIQKR